MRSHRLILDGVVQDAPLFVERTSVDIEQQDLLPKRLGETRRVLWEIVGASIIANKCWGVDRVQEWLV